MPSPKDAIILCVKKNDWGDAPIVLLRCGLKTQAASAKPQPLLLLGKKGLRQFATAEIGIVCKMICPGPCTTVLNSPSPPNSLFLTPGTLTIYIVQVSSIAAR